MTGIINVDVKAKGRLDAVEKEQYQDFDADGIIEAHDLQYAGKELPKTFKVKDMKLTFHPEQIALDTFTAQIGRSDINATGQLINLLGYLFNKGTLKGKLNLYSHVLDLNEFLADTTAAAKPVDTEKRNQLLLRKDKKLRRKRQNRRLYLLHRHRYRLMLSSLYRQLLTRLITTR